MHVPSEPIDPRKPGVMEALCDDDALRVWEQLRIRGEPTDAATVSSELGFAVVRVQRGLDLLEWAELVRKFPASRTRRAITYAVRAEKLVVVASNDAAGNSCLLKLWKVAERRDLDIVKSMKTLEQRSRGEWHFQQVTDFKASRAEIKILQRLFYELSAHLLELARRTDSPGAAQEERFHHAFQLRASGLHGPVARLPELHLLTEQAVTDQRRGRVAPPTSLGRRELEIARLLHAGKSRAEVAGELGISVQTVGSHCKRIFEKLNIRRVTELSRFDFSAASVAPAPRGARASRRPR